MSTNTNTNSSTDNAHDIIGAMVWHTLSDNHVDLDTMVDALIRAGLDERWLVAARTHHHVFLNSMKHTIRYSSNGEQRTLFALRVAQDETETVFTLHVVRGEKLTQRNVVAQVAVVRFKHDQNDVTSEIEGALPSDITDTDIAQIGNFVQHAVERIAKYGGTLTNRRMHVLIRQALGSPDVHAVALRPTGGIYFVPVEGGGLDIVRKLGNAVEDVNGGNTLHVVPQFRDPATVRAVNASARESFITRLASIESELQNIADVTKLSQVTSRRTSIREVIEDARTYADALGMKMDDLNASADRALERLAELEATCVDSRKTRRERRSQRREAASQLESENAKLRALLADAGVDLSALDSASDDDSDSASDDDSARLASEATQRHECDEMTRADIVATCKSARESGSAHLGELRIDFDTNDGYTWAWDGVSGTERTQKGVVSAILG